MKSPKPTLAMLAAGALLAGMTLVPMTVPQAEAQISFHLGWQQPPHDYDQIQQDGFHAGIRAARHDMDNNMPPDPHRHEDFRQPQVPPDRRGEFRDAFRHGYETAYHHHGDWH